jgi:protein tyrosine phosphatase (PTP) superfamily phosphohydrolase (DUF442 family)
MGKLIAFLCAVSIVGFGCASQEGEEQEGGGSEESKIEKLDLEGAKNVYQLTPHLITGGQPEGDEGFAELEKMGVKTIVSVAEEPPDEEAAKKHGIRYVHVPLTYEGVSAEQAARILSAAADDSGPVYVHCNSGRNRAATAAALCLIGIEGKSTQEALDWMKMRGTSEEHTGLFDSVENFEPEP